MPEEGLWPMKIISHVKTLVVFIAIIFVPDMILSFGGRDTYLIHRNNALLYIGRMCIPLMLVVVCVESIKLAGKKQWSKLIIFIAGVSVILSVSTKIVGFLEKKSIAESKSEVELFLKNKGSGDFIISIDDDAKDLYSLYTASNFNHHDIYLVWQVPRFGIYEFRISSSVNATLYIRLYTSQTEPDRIWVHTGEKSQAKT